MSEHTLETPVTTDGTAASQDVSSDGLKRVETGFGLLAYLDICQAFMLEPGDGGIDDRMGSGVLQGATPAATGVRISPPVKAGGLNVLVQGRQLHSIQAPRDNNGYLINGPRAAWFWTTIPAATSVVIPHGLEATPDFMDPHLVSSSAGVVAMDWAVTAIDATAITIENWHPTQDVNVEMTPMVLNSVFAGAQVTGPFDITLNGLPGTGTAHGLPGIPDFVVAFPYSAGGVVRPVGCAVTTAPPDATQIWFGNCAAGVQVLRAYCMLTNSIQR